MQLSPDMNSVYAQLIRLRLVLVKARHGLRVAQRFSERARERAAMLRRGAEETMASNEKVMAGVTAHGGLALVMPATSGDVRKRRHHRAAGVVRCGACGRGIRKAVQMTVERGRFVHTACLAKVG